MKANRLGEMLLEAGLIDRFQLDSALSMQRNLGGRIGSALVKLGYLPEETILDFLQSQLKFSRVSLRQLKIPPEVIGLLSPDKMMKMLVVPLEMRKIGGEKTLRVAMTDPTNIRQLDALQFSTGCRILPVVATEEDIEAAIRHNLPKEGQPGPLPEYGQQPPPAPVKARFTESADDQRLDRLIALLEEKGVLDQNDILRINLSS